MSVPTASSIPSGIDREREVLEWVPKQLYIGGRWRAAAAGATLGVEDPSNGERIAEVADATPEDALAALEAASAMQEEWGAHAPRERGEILRRAYEAMIARADELALLMTLEMGKSVAESRGEIVYAAEFLRWFSEEAVRIHGRYMVAPSGSGRLLTMRQPVGPCVFVTPWNFPTAMGTRKIAPAVAAGCTMVVKPAQQTPLSMLALAQILEDAGLPGGVLNVITAKRSGAVIEPLLKDPRTRKLSFTGSTEVGRTLMAQSAAQVLRVSMELGGNAPFVVFDDADLDAAVEGAMASKYRNTGQTCVCANRLLVQDGVYDAFAEKLARAVNALRVGNGIESGVTQGPLIDAGALAKVEEHIGDALAKGARLVTGGKRHALGGTYFEPTILADVRPDMLVAREETFGPVAPLFRFRTDDEAIAMANDTEVGLAGYFYARDVQRIWRVAEAMECGMVGINTGLISTEVAPFGGVKESGLGREGSKYGIDEYLEIKYLCYGGIGS